MSERVISSKELLSKIRSIQYYDGSHWIALQQARDPRFGWAAVISSPSKQRYTTTLDEILQSRRERGEALAALKARVAELEEAHRKIAVLAPGGPHLSAKEGMTAALDCVDNARIIARKALAGTSPEDAQEDE